MFDYSVTEWQSFSKIERRIIIMVRQYEMDKDRIRELLDWPEKPMNERTFSNHWSKMMGKMSAIRKGRAGVELGHGITGEP